MFLWWNEWNTYYFVTQNCQEACFKFEFIMGLMWTNRLGQMNNFGDVKRGLNSICFVAWRGENLWSSALICKSASLMWTRHFEPFQSSYRSKDQLYKQPYASLTLHDITASIRKENTNFHLLLRENWSGWSRVNPKPPKSCWKTGVRVHSQVCFASTCVERRCLARKKPLLQMWHLKAHQ